MKEEKKIYERECPNPTNNPKCKNIIYYSNEISFKAAIAANKKCLNCSCYIREQKKKQYSLDILLTNHITSFYWMGFILADGHINSKTGLLRIGISVKDREHLVSFAKYVNGKMKIDDKTNICSIRLTDLVVVKKIAEKFGISNVKTYNPPSVKILKKFSDEQIFALIVGFIDGDGYISKRKYAHLEIEVHKSWHKILTFFKKYIGNSTVINVGEKYVRLTNTKFIELKSFKNKILEMNVPHLIRKWDRIDINLLTRNELAESRYREFVSLIQMNYTKNEISKIMDVDLSTIYEYFNHFKINNVINPYSKYNIL